MHFNWTFTGDGLSTLVAGIVAFVAVMIQVRSSSNALRKQLNAEADARREEHERQKRALATALLFDIDNFYEAFMKGRAKVFESWKQAAAYPRALSKPLVVEGSPFAMYLASADKIGLFDRAAVRVILLFYGQASSYLSLRRRHQEARERISRNENVQVEGKVASELEAGITKQSEMLVPLACLCCRALSEVSGSDFSKLLIANECSVRFLGDSAAQSNPT